MFGIEKPTAGRIAVDGRTRCAPARRARRSRAASRSFPRIAARTASRSISHPRERHPREPRRRSRGSASSIAARSAGSVADAIARLDTLAPGVETPVGALSGGNQQKVALSKWLIRKSKVVIFDEPTVGVDVAAKADIYREIGALADAGAGVLIVSSDLAELVGLADRILVFFRGAVVADVEARDADPDRLLTLLTTGRDEEAARDDVAEVAADDEEVARVRAA